MEDVLYISFAKLIQSFIYFFRTLIPGDVGRNIYVALFDFNARTAGDLSFNRGEFLEITDNQGGKWWKGRSLNSKKEGYIPSNYIEPYDSLKSHE